MPEDPLFALLDQIVSDAVAFCDDAQNSWYSFN